jgi:hypothetical protein
MSSFFSSEEKIDAALRKFHQRAAGWAAVPRGYEEIFAADEDEDHGAGDYEMRQRALGARAILLWIVGEGLHPKKLLKRLLVVGRACATEPFSLLTMEESALLCDEEKATHSARCKVLSGLMKKAGMKGFKIAGQKAEGSTAKYAAAARGNKNRANSVVGRKFQNQKNQKI